MPRRTSSNTCEDRRVCNQNGDAINTDFVGWNTETIIRDRRRGDRKFGPDTFYRTPEGSTNNGDSWTVKHFFLRFSLWMLGLGLLIHASAGFFYVLMPMEFWIDYKNVEPIASEFDINDPAIHFISNFQTFRSADVQFRDTLFCDPGDGLGFHRQGQAQNKQYFLGRQEVVDSVFPFPNLADEAGICYLDTTVVLELPLNIERYKKVRTAKFKITGGLKK